MWLGWVNFPYIIMIRRNWLECSDRTVTLTQQSGRYSVDNYTAINCWNCCHIQSGSEVWFSKIILQSEGSCILNTVITAEMTNLRDVIPKKFIGSLHSKIRPGQVSGGSRGASGVCPHWDFMYWVVKFKYSNRTVTSRYSIAVALIEIMCEKERKARLMRKKKVDNLLCFFLLSTSGWA